MARAADFAGVPLRVAIGAADPFADAVRALRKRLPDPAAVTVSTGCHDGRFCSAVGADQVRAISTALAVDGCGAPARSPGPGDLDQRFALVRAASRSGPAEVCRQPGAGHAPGGCALEQVGPAGLAAERRRAGLALLAELGVPTAAVSCW